MKRVLVILLVVLLLATNAGAVSLYVDYAQIKTDVMPTIVGGRTMVPMRAIFEALGATVEWDGPSRTATGVLGDKTVAIQIDNTTAYVNGEAKTLDVPAKIIGGRTMVPARFVSESLGCSVTWDGETQTAAVANVLNGQKIYITRTGKHFHIDSTCNGGTYFECTLAQAMGMGLTPCGKCIGN